jgi:hypothetical protein
MPRDPGERIRLHDLGKGGCHITEFLDNLIPDSRQSDNHPQDKDRTDQDEFGRYNEGGIIMPQLTKESHFYLQ